MFFDVFLCFFLHFVWFSCFHCGPAKTQDPRVGVFVNTAIESAAADKEKPGGSKKPQKNGWFESCLKHLLWGFKPQKTHKEVFGEF